MRGLLSSPVIATLIGGCFGVFAVWLALWRYKSERWWERKAAAYAGIVEALHIIEDVYNERIQAIEKSVQLPIERVDKIRIAERDAHAEIRKYASLGGFVITPRAAAALGDLTEVLSQSPRETLDKYYNDRAMAAAAAIDAVKREANTDLRT
jgi:hypothetical protein